jgi:dCMP deaminase
VNEKWDKRFLELAEHVAEWSRDPSTKVGAVIVDQKKRIVSVGFNGLPQSLRDDERLNNREFKYGAIVHGEINAILFAERSLTDCTLYTWPWPICLNCAPIVIQSGIKRVVAPSGPPERWKASMERARALFEEAGIVVDLKV